MKDEPSIIELDEYHDPEPTEEVTSGLGDEEEAYEVGDVIFVEDHISNESAPRG